MNSASSIVRRRPAAVLIASSWTAVAGLACAALAQPATDTPVAPPASTGAAAPASPRTLVSGVEGDPARATAVLDRFKSSWAALRSVNYALDLVGVGDNAANTPNYRSLVRMTRAEAGGWKMHASGTIAGGANPDASQDFDVAFDGATARSVRHTDKVVFERDVREPADLLSFLNAQGARQGVLWELIDREKPFDAVANAVHQGTADVGGVACDVVFFPTTADAGDAPAPADGPAANPDAPAPPANASHGTRIYFATTDALPRRIERVRIAGAIESGQAATITDWKVDADAVAGIYAMSIPDGYRVRVQKAARPIRRADAGDAPADGLLPVGKPAPDFALKDPSGKQHTLADYKGKVVLIDFWATWCGPCIRMMPMMDRLHDLYKDRGVVILGVHVWANPQSPEPVAFFKEKGHQYTLLLEGDPVASAYKVTGIPAFYLIAPDGTVRFRTTGANPALEPRLKREIDAMLDNPGQQ